jgi:predicted glycoside hydrolase/deacetylase ChbG (UPF0249 family)
LNRKLVVNADDFGFAHDVNRGIVEAHVNGILTATTLMANGSAFSDAVRLARDHRSLDIGVHCVLVQGESLLPGRRRLPASVGELIEAIVLRRIRVYDEIRAQLERIVDAGLSPTHLDTHKHTHLLPAVLDAVCRLSQEFRIPWVRRPFDFPIESNGVAWTKRVVSRSMTGVRRTFHRKLERYGCRTTDWFAGFQFTGRFQAAQLAHILEQLPEGSTEFMCHPGRCTDELRRLPTRLKEARETELMALMAADVRAVLERQRIELVNYRQLT